MTMSRKETQQTPIFHSLRKIHTYGLPSLFSKQSSEELIKRIDSLNDSSPSVFGTMNVAQMLAPCNVSYEMI